MKKALVLSLVLLLGVAIGGMAKTNFFDNLYIEGDVTVEGTVTFGDLDVVGDLGLTGNADFNGATMLFDGSTSVRNVSASFTSNEAPAIRLGSDAYTYMTVAVTSGTGNVAITQSGSNTSLTWTASGGFDLQGAIELDAITGVGNLDVNGTTAIIDGSTSVRGISAGFTSLEAPAIRFGSDAYTYMTVAVTADTGDVAITQSGSNTAMSWTAAGGFDFIGAIELDGTTIVGDLNANGALMVLDGSTSVRGISAAFTSLEAPAIRFGSDAYTYMTVAVTADTGDVAITQSGSNTAMSWTASGGFDFVGAIELDGTTIVGDLDANGALMVLDGSTSVRNVSAGFTSNEAPAIRFGPDIYTYMTIAVTGGTGDVAITQSGSNTAMSWTAAGGFDFVGSIELDATTVTSITDGTASLSSGDLTGLTSIEMIGDLTMIGDLLQTGSFLITGNTTQTGSITLLGSGGDITIGDDADIIGDLDVGGTANLDVVDIDDAVNIAATVTHIGDYLQTGSFLITGDITQTGSTTITVNIDVDGTTNLDVTDIDDTLNVQGVTTFQANQLVANATNAGGIFVSQYALTYVQSASTTICTLPANVDVIDVVIVVQTAFNDSGTDLFDLGWSGTLEGYAQNLPVQTASVVRTGDSGMLYANLGDVGGSTRDLLGIYTGQNSDSSAGALSIYVYWTLGVPGVP